MQLRHPIDDALQACQPVIIAPDGVYCPAPRGQRAEVVMSTARGVEIPMQRMCTDAALMQRFAVNLPAVHTRLESAVANCGVATGADAVSCFMAEVVPALCGVSRPAPSGARGRKLAARIEESLSRLPRPVVPCPALLFLGRLWLLAAGSRHGSMTVRWRGETFTLSGQFLLVAKLRAQWEREVQTFVDNASRRIAADVAGEGGVDADIQSAAAEFGRGGVLACKDLLLLPGNPERLGVLFPAHYNVSLARHIKGDGALTTPLTMIGQGMEVYLRGGSTWARTELPRNTCLGPPIVPPGSEPFAVRAGFFLRAAATRFAQNGRFHENDE